MIVGGYNIFKAFKLVIIFEHYNKKRKPSELC